MRSRPRPHLVRIGCLFAAFCLGSLITYVLHSSHPRPAWYQPVSDADRESAADTSSSGVPNLLLVLILSAPDNLERRNAIRQTWLPLAAAIPAPLDRSSIRSAVHVPLFNAAGFVGPESVDAQAANLRLQRDALPKLPRMRRPEHFVPVGVRHRFVVGTAGLPRSTRNQLDYEQQQNGGDMLLLGDLVDNYQNLTRKLLHALDAVVYGEGIDGISGELYTYRYVLKCDDDTYVKLDRLTAELLVYDELMEEKYPRPARRPELYWGYFSANAHVRQAGRWAEQNYVLGDRYHPYALGGGYVLSRGAVRWVAQPAALLSRFSSEDVSMGLWLSTLRTVYRRHDVRFDTAWLQRRCADYHLVLHKRSVRDMKMVRGGGLCSGVEDDDGAQKALQRPVEYFYNWTSPVAQCCVRRVV